jgi:hypothetical protein
MTEIFPNQYTTRSAKTDDTFYKPTYDFLIRKALALNDKTNIQRWLDASNGIIDTVSIRYLSSPIKLEDNTDLSMPGVLRDSDLINTIRERNLSEYIGLPYKFVTNVFNGDAIEMRDFEVAQEVDKLVQQAFVNIINQVAQQQQAQQKAQDNAQAQQTTPSDGSQQQDQPNATTPPPQQPTPVSSGLPSQDIPNIEDFAKQYIADWIDKRAIQGQHILEYINALNDFDTKRFQVFYYWWACEEFYTYREIINNEVYTSVIHPLNAFPIYNNSQFVEDYDGFVIRNRTTITQLKTSYWDQFTKKEQDYLTSLKQSQRGSWTAPGQILVMRALNPTDKDAYRNGSTYDVTDESEALDEFTLIWRTYIPVKIKTYQDPLGHEMKDLVDNDYVTQEGETINTEYIEEVWIGKRFGNQNTGIYLEPKPCPVQRYDRHLIRPKLPVGGKKGILHGILQNPIPKRLINYVIIDEIITLHIERTLATHQSHINVIPQSMINPDNMGTTKEKIFYIKADNTLFYDDSKVDLNVVNQAFRVVNMPSLEGYLKALIDVRDKYRAEALQMANMNQEKLGEVQASLGKGVMNEAIYRATLGNVLGITMFNAALERDHVADLEFSKIAYITGKKVSYIDKRLSKSITVDVDPFMHLEAEYGVTVTNSKVDEDKIKAYRQFGFNAGQNGEFELAAAALDGDTIPELRQALKAIIKANKEFKAQQDQQAQESQEQIAEQASQDKAADRQNEKDITDMKGQYSVQVATITAASGMTEKGGDPNTYDKFATEIAKNNLKDRELNVKRQMTTDKLNVEREKIKSNEKIAKENRNKYDTKIRKV